MGYQEVLVGGKNGDKYKLPNGVTFQTFNWDRTVAILKDGLNGPFSNGAAVVDSFDIRRPPEGKSAQNATRDLLVQHGAVIVAFTPNSAVA